MKDLLILLIHLLTKIARLLGPGGAKAIVANSLLMKQQLQIVKRGRRRRAPDLLALERFLLGFLSLFLSPSHILRAVSHLDTRSGELDRQCNALRQEEIIEEIEVILRNAISGLKWPHGST